MSWIRALNRDVVRTATTPWSGPLDLDRPSRVPVWHIGERVIAPHDVHGGSAGGPGMVVGIADGGRLVWVTLDDGGDVPFDYRAEELRREPTI